ncbi:DUF2531 domain-containing protein [Pantoea rodasii]|uniref:DUF2531 domain-containing protein n=2 Tax=Pantoea rodasii TaxID=1076549 RepID=A0A2M9WCL7_9GAMM|nr:HofP DNA utilization family protein [Pantoea rodasii]PJZ05290.1 DUF2531 domain-containing protein [Pantoea rodasii]
MRSRAWLLLLYSGIALARDPFQPLSEVRCHSQVAKPDGWRLQGIIGTSTHSVAWLVSPHGKSHRLTAQETLPQTDWHIAELTSNRLLLRAAQSCSPQQITWLIKGGYYEMDGPNVVSQSESVSTGK